MIPKEVPVALANDREPNWVPPLTDNPVVVALEKETFNADREPKLLPPETVSPVVVALPAVMFPKAERLITLIEPKDAPPVTESEVEVPAPKTKEPRLVPPETVSPVVVAF